MLQRRDQPRHAAASENGSPAAAPPALELDALQEEEVVDLADDDIVEIRESAAPPPAAVTAQPERAAPPPAVVAPRPVPAVPLQPAPVEPPPSVPPYSVGQLPVEAESYSAPINPSEIPVAYEPERSQPPPAREAGAGWPSSVPPRAETPETSFAESAPPPAPVQAERPGFGLDFDDEEEPPASSRRAIASSMDEALADAAAREVPLKTPPPESGPQEAVILPKGAGVPEPDVDEAPPGAAEASTLAEGLPTSAQLGNTVTLEEGGAVDFEVEAPAEARHEESAPPPSEDFEIRLPQREAAGTYDSNLAPPPEAQSELDAHRERAAVAAAQAEAVEPIPPLAPIGALDDTLPDENESYERSAVRHGPVTTVTGAPQRFRPGSFLELLDASLKLGKN
ncbi:MAG TPA: hypothetical protein VI197_25365 [Polyangiaceae bacterium]